MNSFLVLRCQRPHLSGSNAQAIGKRSLSIDYALAEDVAITLPVVRSHARTQPVCLPVAGQFDIADLAFSEQAEPALTGGQVGLTELGQRISCVRNAGEWRVDIRARRPRTVDGCRFDEPARGYGDAFVMERGGASQLLNAFLSFLESQYGTSTVVFDVRNIVLDCGHALLLRCGL